MLTYEETDVTPELAERWLAETNLENRDISPHAVSKYARMMSAGQWLTDNGVPLVIFDTNGVLADGQQRLKAVVRSGVTLRGAQIARGANPAARPTIDEGNRRMFKDDLAMAGVRNSFPAASLARRIFIWDRDGGLRDLLRMSVSRPELAQLWPGVADEVLESVRLGSRYSLRWPGNKGSLVFMYWLLRFRDHVPVNEVDRFLRAIEIGSMQDEDRVLVQCHDKLARVGNFRNADEGQYKRVEYEVYWLIVTWNNWKRGRHLTKFQLPKGGKLVNPYPGRVGANQEAADDSGSFAVLARA